MLHHAPTSATVRRLRAARERLELTIPEVAARAGLRPVEVQAIETGAVADPTLSHITALAQAVNMPVGVLCEGDDGGFDRALASLGADETVAAEPLPIERLTNLTSIETNSGIAILRGDGIDRASVFDLPEYTDPAGLATALSHHATAARLIYSPAAGGRHRTLLAIQAPTLGIAPAASPAAAAAQSELGARALDLDGALTALREHVALLPVGALNNDYDHDRRRIYGQDLRSAVEPLGLAADARGVYTAGRAGVAYRLTGLPENADGWLAHLLGRSGVTIAFDLNVTASVTSRALVASGGGLALTPETVRQVDTQASAVALCSAANLPAALDRADELAYAAAEAGVGVKPQTGRHAYALAHTLPAGPTTALHDDVFAVSADAVSTLAL